MKFSELKLKSFTNPADIPHIVTFELEIPGVKVAPRRKPSPPVRRRYYLEYVGIGWEEIQPTEAQRAIVDADS